MGGRGVKRVQARTVSTTVLRRWSLPAPKELPSRPWATLTVRSPESASRQSRVYAWLEEALAEKEGPAGDRGEPCGTKRRNTWTRGLFRPTISRLLLASARDVQKTACPRCLLHLSSCPTSTLRRPFHPLQFISRSRITQTTFLHHSSISIHPHPLALALLLQSPGLRLHPCRSSLFLLTLLYLLQSWWGGCWFLSITLLHCSPQGGLMLWTEVG